MENTWALITADNFLVVPELSVSNLAKSFTAICWGFTSFMVARSVALTTWDGMVIAMAAAAAVAWSMLE